MEKSLVRVSLTTKPFCRTQKEFEGLSATMESAVWCVINISLSENIPNIVASGYSKKQPLSADIELDNTSKVYSSYPNTVQNYLLTEEWDTLLSRIGLYVLYLLFIIILYFHLLFIIHLKEMVILLFECVFVPVKRNSYIQVSGEAITKKKSEFQTLEKNGQKDNIFQKVVPRPLYFRKWKVTRTKKAKHQAQELFRHVKKPSRRGAKRLILDIFSTGLSDAERKRKKKKYECLYLKPWMNTFIGPIQKLMRNHLRCKYAAMLSKTTTHFSLYSETEGTVLGGEKDPLMKLLVQYTPKHEIVRFLWCAFDRVIPPQLFGSSLHNRTTLKSALKRYVGLKKKEHMCTSHLIRGLRVREIPWLIADTTKKVRRGQRQIMLGKMVYWLFDSFFCPLIKSFFYCTDASPSHSTIYYYHHQLWKEIKKLAVNKLVSTSFMEPIPTLARMDVAFSHLRILPKATGVRPILVMSRNSPMRLDLKRPFSVLTFEKV